MTQVTDEMVEAACNKEWELVQHWPLRGEERFVYMNKPNMRAVLEAALAVAPDPAPDDAESLPTNGPSIPNNAASLRTNAAGYEIVRRDAPIQKPEPDWGRRGTQPKGTLGPPPPPNGQRVAMKPLPPTPGPFNPFGKQDFDVPSQILIDAFGEPASIEEVAPNTFKYTWTDDDVESP